MGINGVSHLVNGKTLAGERGFSACQVGNINHTNVGRDTIAKLNNNDITRNNILSRDLSCLSIANYFGFTGKHSLESVGGLFGRPFLHDTDPGIEGNDKDDECYFEPVGDGIFGRLGGEGLGATDDGDNDKNTDENIVDLFPDATK